jgi:hypothetical protein
LPENELPDNGTFGKDGQKVEEDTKVDAESSSGSSSSTIPPPKKQCGTDKSVSGGEGGDMLTADKVCLPFSMPCVSLLFDALDACVQ